MKKKKKKTKPLLVTVQENCKDKKEVLIGT